MTEELKKEGEASRKKTLHQVKKLLIDGADEEMLDKIRSIIDKEYEKGNFYSKTHIKSVFYRWSRFEFNTFLIKFIEIYKGSVSYWLTDVLNIQEEVSAYCPLEGESLSMTVWCPIINYINGLPSEVSTTGDKKMTEEKLNIERVIIEEVIKMESKELGELFTALGKAQGEMKVAKANVVNSYFKSKYADLTSIVNASRPALSKYGLSIIQRVLDGEKDTQWLYTRLCHASGQWMESKMKINPPKADIQSMGSYLTYLKRYNMASIIGCTAGEEDDDGESAMKESRDIDTVAKSNPNITKAQLQVLSKELEGYEEILESLLKGYNIEKLSEIPAKTYSSCLDRIRNIKKAKDINNG